MANRRRALTSAGVIALLAVVWFLVPLGGGPLQMPTGTDEGACVTSGGAAIFGTDVLRDATFAPVTVLSVWPGRVSPGLAIRIGLSSASPFNAGMVGASRAFIVLHPLRRLPVTLGAFQSATQGSRIWVEAHAYRNSSYGVQGIYVLYRWLGHPFIAYFPDRLTYQRAKAGGCAG